MKNIRIAIVYYSKYGHTQVQAEAVRRGAASCEGTETLLLTAAEAAARLDELDDCDAIVFGTATFMGNIAAEFKKFLEATVGRWVSRAWSGKIAGGFTTSSNFSGDKGNTLTGLLTAAMQLGMIWVGVDDLPGGNEPESAKTLAGPGPDALNRVSASLGAMAESFHLNDPQQAPGPGDLRTAENYGLRIARITRQFRNGRA